MEINIVWKNGYAHAYAGKDVHCCSFGKSEAEAVGKLILSRKQLFGIQIISEQTSSPTDQKPLAGQEPPADKQRCRSCKGPTRLIGREGKTIIQCKNCGDTYLKSKPPADEQPECARGQIVTPLPHRGFGVKPPA